MRYIAFTLLVLLSIVLLSGIYVAASAYYTWFYNQMGSEIGYFLATVSLLSVSSLLTVIILPRNGK